ncbi:cobalt ECF transporter T component CbiQ [Promineifilum sp.]|uniref:cobalt ECF transporter T component CbiQ n=1 Tax=Promineifilum sp. TaxID=2664178 RepID=UPI0035B47831
MNANAFDRYLERPSPLHRLDPRVKVVLTLAFIVSVALLPERAWAAYLAAFLLVMGAALTGRLSPWLVVRRSLLGLPFLLAAVTILFTVPGEALWRGPLGLTVTDAGAARFAGIVLRSLISIQAAVLLTAATRVPDILHALRHLRVPAVLVSIIAFMFRYLFVLVEEVQRLLRARAARSAHLPGVAGGGGVRWRAEVAGHMAGQLLVRSLDRSDRVYQAMQARGYRGELLTLSPHVMRPADWVWLALGTAAIGALQVMARL